MNSNIPSSPLALSGGDILSALAVVVIWGLNFVTMKVALVDFTPFQLGAARYVFALLPLIFLVRAPKDAWKWLLAYGLCQGVGQFGLLFVALKVGMTAALASVLMQTQVFFTAIFGYVLLKEKLTRPLQLGLVCAAVGLGCFAMNYVGDHADRSLLVGTTVAGFLLNLAAAAMWAGSNIIARRAQQKVEGFNALGFVVWSSLVPIIPFCLASWLLDPVETRWAWTSASWASWLSAIYLGWFATILAYALWTGLLRRHPANRIAPFSLGVPVIGLLAGVLMLGETVTSWQLAGATCIVVSLGVVLLWKPSTSKS
ncbi:EamA family transporter [Bordetella sp. 02P26C-1]|nr:EamA family transporter [Bordetella sp. 02P26C-1]